MNENTPSIIAVILVIVVSILLIGSTVHNFDEARCECGDEYYD